MLFNSLDFAWFLPATLFIYWIVLKGRLRFQNIFLLIASYIFYGWWDYRFLGLIAFSSLLDFFLSQRIETSSTESKRKLFLGISLTVNLGLLAICKYYNFFIDSFVDAFSFFGTVWEPDRLNIILPVGISFYTFQTLSYSIDVYRRKLTPTKDILSFFAFVSFFPQLVAGPIERAVNLLPQFDKEKTIDRVAFSEGFRQILWGLFKKMVIADNCAMYVNEIFGNYADHSASTLLLGAVFFAFQIYGDFSGYSDIAIGTARLFGFKLMKNFAFPYFSRDIAEFWRRWHISLSTWFRDYLYIPLGGSRGGLYKKVRNTFVIFVVSGFWHGANWTYMAWGFLNALYFLPLLLSANNRNNLDVVAQNKMLPNIKEIFQMLFTFTITVFAWIFFRADTIGDAFSYIGNIFDESIISLPHQLPSRTIYLILAFLFVEWLQRREEHGLDIKNSILAKYDTVRRSFYAMIILVIAAFGAEEQEFIYFQF